MNFIGKYDSIKKYNDDNYSKNVSFQDFIDDISKEHSYMGAQYLYLRDKLEKNKTFSNIREQNYKDQFIHKYDYYHYITFVIYWILFAFYVIFFIYKQQYKNIPSVITLIIMGTFPFYIHLLTNILIKLIKQILKFVKTFNIILPSFKNQREDVDYIENKLMPKVETSSSFKSKNDEDKNKKEIKYKKEFINILNNLSEGNIDDIDEDDKQIKILDGNNDITYYWEKDENNKWVKTVVI